LGKTDTANLADGHRIFVAPASRRRVFIQAAHRKTAGETPAPQNHAENFITVRAMVYGRYTPLIQGRPKAPFCA
jgi:hypothetical protein